MSRAASHLEVGWHDAECGGYGADLGLWKELARAHGAAGVLELGAGSGRVALVLAREGFDVTAVDRSEPLCEALGARAEAAGLAVTIECADARELSFGRRFGLVLAPMQLFQLLGGHDGRRRALAAIAGHLAPGGVAAVALVEAVQEFEPGSVELLPDLRELDGWLYSSVPVAARDLGDRIELVRDRAAVGPGGELHGEQARIELDRYEPAALEADAAAAGLVASARRTLGPTADHVGSTVVLLERG